ncbi:MAG: PilZ domain-containing protein [Methylococcaceae bacterium]|nr:PilZ domain-containing protein [Methylococcaceae bacterium]
MKEEKRSHQRITPAIHNTTVVSSKETSLHAEIIDISQTGIRIKFKESLQNQLENKVKITLYLPDSGIPFSVNCLFQNQHTDTEYGLHYIQDNKVQESIDDMLFKCVKLEDPMFLIRSPHPPSVG